MSVSTHAEKPLIVGHRGVSRDAPENTLLAFQQAWEQGADAIEGDFHLSKDGEIVCVHDRTTEKIASERLVVRASTLAELRRLDVGSHRGAQFKGVSIPTLTEVLSTVPKGKKIFIEIKCGVEVIPALIDVMGQSDLVHEQLVVISFDQGVIQQLKAQAPFYKAYWCCDFKKQKTGTLSPSLDTVMKTLRQTQADGLSSNRSVPVPVVEAVRKQGYEWHVWTINDLKTAQRMQAMGALSITTDVPGRLRTQLGLAPFSSIGGGTV